MRTFFKFLSKSRRSVNKADLEMKKNLNGDFSLKQTKGEMLDGLLPLADFAHKGLGNVIYLAGFFALVLGGTQYLNTTMRVYGSAGILNAAIDYANPQQNPQRGMVTNCGASLSGIFHTEDAVFTPHFACGEHVFVKSMETGKLTSAVVAHQPLFHEGSTRVADISLSIAQKLGVDEKAAVAPRIALASMDAKLAGVAQFIPYKDVGQKEVDFSVVSESLQFLHTQNLVGELEREITKDGAKNMLPDLLATIYLVENRVRMKEYPNTVEGVLNAGMSRGKRCDFSWNCSRKEVPSPITHKELWLKLKQPVLNALTDNIPPRYASIRYSTWCAENYIAEGYYLQTTAKVPGWYWQRQKLNHLRGDIKYHTFMVNPKRKDCGTTA